MHDLFESALVERCAPVLLGKKPAALFPKPVWWKSAHMRLFARYDLCCEAFSRTERRDLLFVYRPHLLSPALLRKPVPRALKALGYPVSGCLDDDLRALSRRLAKSSDFPHEIGFFLGYPPEDVLGFMRHGGRNYKLCGSWKVYGDVEKARALFSEFSNCKSLLLAVLRDGGSILGIGDAAGAS
ncbi:MAG: DUF3793 family protein [Clostridiales Family XIII bacterium]|jgi:hypothetical protein|nr:DUF3793 family protein [Clostridiales Family XIII bacterium]